jgi:hypothetical protein
VKAIRNTALLTASLLTIPTAMAAVTETLDERDIARALNIANSGETARVAFHAPYVLVPGEPTIEQLEVITEFRRFVLAAEEQLKAGNWMLGRGGFDQKGRSLKDLLRPSAGQVSVRARLRFHPQNTYVEMPPADILLGDPTLLPISTTRTPHVFPVAEPGAREVFSGTTAETYFNAPSIADRVLAVRIVFDGRELARVPVDFSRFE